MEIYYFECDVAFLQTAIPASAKWNYRTELDASGNPIQICLNRKLVKADGTADYPTRVEYSIDGLKAIVECCATRGDELSRFYPLTNDDNLDWAYWLSYFGLVRMTRSEYITKRTTDPNWIKTNPKLDKIKNFNK